MKTDQIVMCVVALLLGMLLANMLKNVCGCKVVEGQGNSPPPAYAPVGDPSVTPGAPGAPSSRITSFLNTLAKESSNDSLGARARRVQQGAQTGVAAGIWAGDDQTRSGGRTLQDRHAAAATDAATLAVLNQKNAMLKEQERSNLACRNHGDEGREWDGIRPFQQPITDWRVGRTPCPADVAGDKDMKVLFAAMGADDGHCNCCMQHSGWDWSENFDGENAEALTAAWNMCTTTVDIGSPGFER